MKYLDMLILNEKADQLLENENLCDHCLGRQFAQLGHGLENFERAQIIINTDKLEEDNFDRENVPDDAEIGGECEICSGVFDELDRWADLVEDSFERYELETFLIGIRPLEESVRAEEELWEEYGVEWTEPLKTELSRLLGKKMEDRMDIQVDFERADVMAVIDMREGRERVELQVNSLLIYGQYNKHSREIPQTEWHCRKCRGSGCEECDWTGHQYPTSVQQEIEVPFLRESKAVESKFHGGGREDVDAKCLGKREFVLELVEPLNRDVNLEELKYEVNESTDKVELFNVKFTHKDKAAEIKQKHADKEYRAVIETEEEITEEDLENISEVVGGIEQDTPERVEHRRAEKTRKREVYEVSWEKTGEKEFELEVKAEAGTYIKELIHGDKGRTQPNISELIGTQAECFQLDVIWIEK
jgi:tRNA pseudouridine synthase 10